MNMLCVITSVHGSSSYKYENVTNVWVSGRVGRNVHSSSECNHLHQPEWYYKPEHLFVEMTKKCHITNLPFLRKHTTNTHPHTHWVVAIWPRNQMLEPTLMYFTLCIYDDLRLQWYQVHYMWSHFQCSLCLQGFEGIQTALSPISECLWLLAEIRQVFISQKFPFIFLSHFCCAIVLGSPPDCNNVL